MPGIFKNRIFAGKQKPFDAIHHLCTVKFLDNSEAISFTYERNTKGRFLVDHVCSSINLIEKDYFGLKYTDADKQECWLDPEKAIYSQIKGLSNPVLYFQVRFYPSELDSIKEEITRYQLFLQVRKDFNEQRLICSLQDALLLTAYVVQEELGDYNQLDDWHDHFSKIKLPPSMLEYDSYIAVLHQQLKGLSQSDAEYKFLKKAVSLNSYGIDPYVVSDKEDYQMYLTVAPKGLITFEENIPTRTYHWRNIGKLSFDGKSFHIKLDGREKGSGGRLFNKHLNTSLFACTSAKKKPHQKATVTYKCLSHTNCKQLWKNAMAYKYFYTLQSSSEAPKVLSSGGLFSRGSKFRYSGSCLAEIRRSSASIDREEPRVTRHLSNVQINEDSRYSTLPRKWKPDSSFAEDACDTKLTQPEAQVNESINEKEQFMRRTSSESALGNTPVKTDLKAAPYLHENDTLESKGECTKEVEKAKESEFIECFISPEQNFMLIPSFKDDDSMATTPSAWNDAAKKEGGTSEKVDDSNQGDDIDDVDGRDVGRVNDAAEYSPHASEETNVSSSSEVTSTTACSLVDSVASSVDDNLKDAWKSTGLAPNLQTIDPKMRSVHPNISGDLSINSSRDESTEVPSEESSFHESLIQPRMGMKAIKRKRQESGSGYDTGYMSSGSERMSRSFESEDHALDFTALKNNGIVEEMEFPTSDGTVLGEGERIGHEISSDYTEDQPSNDMKPNALIRDNLLSMLSYGSEEVSSFIKNASTGEKKLKRELEAKDGLCCGENVDLTLTSSFPAGDFSSSTSSSYPSFFESFPKTTADKSGEPPRLPSSPPSSVGFLTSFGSGHSLTSGVFSSDNFRRIKEIEQMIEDNKNKIQLMKQTISSEMKRSHRTNPAEPCQRELSPVHTDDSAYLKQPKHVSFSSHRTEWYHKEKDRPYGNLRSWTGMEAINRNNDQVSSDNYQPVLKTEEIIELIVPRTYESVMESSGDLPVDAGRSEFVEKVPPVSSDGTFVSQAELCKCSDDGELDEDDSNNCPKEDAGCQGNSNKDNIFRGIPANNDTTDNIPTPSSGDGNSSSNLSSDTSKKSPMMEKRFEQFTFSETVVEEVVKITPEVIRSLSADFHLPAAASNPTATSVARDVDVVTCESALNLTNEQNLTTSGMSTDDLLQAVELQKECSGSKEFLQKSEEHSSSRSVMKSICKRTGLTLLSVMLSLLFFGVCLAIIFELDREIPYVTDQKTVIALKKSVYEPARAQVVKYFKK